MIGVVVWADTAKRKAVIWCEDQRDLAYFLPSEEALVAHAPDRGDLVKFEICYKGTMRLARNVEVVEAKSQTAIADALRDGSSWARRHSMHRGAQAGTSSIPEQGRSTERVTRLRDGREGAKILPFPELMRA